MTSRLPADRREVLRLDDGRQVDLHIRRSRRARRMRLSVDQAAESVELVLPPRAPLADGMALVERYRGWLLARLKTLPPRLAFADGAMITVLGQPLHLGHRPQARRGVWAEAGVLHVSGEAEHLARRVTDWLRRLARREIAARAHAQAARLGKPVAAISVRDPRTRWGSCSPGGRLSFSWRLVLAPPEVLDYVVAHEVAHLVEMNHGPRFWSLVASLHPEMAAARAWLKRFGPALHRCG